jgi:t-SNARE complex subunit (syntaxin)
LKGDNLAFAAGMLPKAYRQLCEMDPVAELAEHKGRADGEKLASTQLHKAAEQGDAKAALAILQNVHGWVAKQSLTVDVNQQISILGALAEAERRAAPDIVDAIAHEPSLTLQVQNAKHQVQR